MRVLILLLLLSVGCGHIKKGPLRVPAQSLDIKNIDQELDLQNSVIKFFPPEKNKDGFLFYVFLEGRNASRELIDIDTSKLKLMDSAKIIHNVEISRVAKGKYYFNFLRPFSHHEFHLKMTYENQLLLSPIKLSLLALDNSKTSLISIGVVQDGVKLRLALRDRLNRSVKVAYPPEILVTGDAVAEDLHEVTPGNWEFIIRYPNYNQVIYISVRVHGDFFGNMLRIQHVEK